MDLHHNAPPGVLNIKEMKSLLIFASMGLKATILSFENLQRENLFLHEQSRKYKIFTQQFPFTSDEHLFSVFSEEEPDLNSELEISVSEGALSYDIKMNIPMFQTTETVEAIVTQLLEKQRTARMTGSLDCSDPDSTCLDSKSCIHQVRD